MDFTAVTDKQHGFNRRLNLHCNTLKPFRGEKIFKKQRRGLTTDYTVFADNWASQAVFLMRITTRRTLFRKTGNIHNRSKRRQQSWASSSSAHLCSLCLLMFSFGCGYAALGSSASICGQFFFMVLCLPRRQVQFRNLFLHDFRIQRLHFPIRQRQLLYWM